MQLTHPTVEEVMNEENDVPIPSLSKGKQRENSADPGPSTSKGKQRENPAVPSTSHIPVKKVKLMPKFEIKDPKMENRKFEPQYKYGSELNNSTNPEVVFKKVLDQPVTLKLGEILGLSFKLG